MISKIIIGLKYTYKKQEIQYDMHNNKYKALIAYWLLKHLLLEIIFHLKPFLRISIVWVI